MRKILIISIIFVLITNTISAESPIVDVKSESPSNSSSSCYIPDCRWCDKLDYELCECHRVAIKCAPGYITSKDGCSCIEITSPSESESSSCNIPDCRWCDKLDLSTCQCYRIAIDCAPGYDLSPDGCSCIKNNNTVISDYCPGLVCKLPQQINEARCECTDKICKPLVACKPGYVLDLETCECVCGLRDYECPRNSFVDLETCKCRDPICDPILCDYGQSWDPKLCRCVCDYPPKCPSDLYVNDNSTCECVCKEGLYCDIGYILDELTCKCVPDHNVICPPPFIYDPILCKCVCGAEHKCPRNYYWDMNKCKCSCVQNQMCMGGFIWNPSICDCECNMIKDCKENFIFDKKACDCVCDPKLQQTSCPSGFIFDVKSCQCVAGVKPECPDKFVYSPEDCGCVCAEVKECQGMEVFDEDTCECFCHVEAESLCQAGYFDKEYCSCIIKD